MARLVTDLLFAPTQAFTGEVPFHPALTSSAILAILDKKRPARPGHPHLTNELWTLMGRCWSQDRHLRPEMLEVLEVLRGSSVSSGSQGGNYGASRVPPCVYVAVEIF